MISGIFDLMRVLLLSTQPAPPCPKSISRHARHALKRACAAKASPLIIMVCTALYFH